MTVNGVIEEIYRRDRLRVFSSLVRLLGSLDRAEEALHDAFKAAAERWPIGGIPGNPVAWLISAGRFRAIDRLRREERFAPWDENAQEAEAHLDPAGLLDDKEILEDDQLRLIFTCCHPSLSELVRIALTLREVCGLTTEAIASAVLVKPTTLAQRIVRAKAKIRIARLPYQVPDENQLPERLTSVLRVVYLIFNEGYSPSAGNKTTNAELSQEAVRLGRLLKDLLQEPEVDGLLALMLLQESRRAARESANGDLILLEEQDRSLWDHALILEGQTLVEGALRSRRFGPYTLQAAIAAVHSEAKSLDETDWPQIVGLYDVLLRLEPSPVIALNRAVAVAMRDGPAAGLPAIDALLHLPEMRDYGPAHAARGELYRRLGHLDEAREAFMEAMRLTNHGPAQRHFCRRIESLTAR
jgi:RNA polymerase sigma-70 factor, ECF subfamily